MTNKSHPIIEATRAWMQKRKSNITLSADARRAADGAADKALLDAGEAVDAAAREADAAIATGNVPAAVVPQALRAKAYRDGVNPGQTYEEDGRVSTTRR